MAMDLKELHIQPQVPSVPNLVKVVVLAINLNFPPFSWFGSIMAGKEPVVESTLCRNILLDHYDLVCAAVIGLTTSSSVRHYRDGQNGLY